MAGLDLGNWAGLEETPTQYPEEVEPTGNTSSCYLCGRSFQQLPQEYIIRRDYKYNAADSKRERDQIRRYFMTFCLWCAHSHKL